MQLFDEDAIMMMFEPRTIDISEDRITEDGLDIRITELTSETRITEGV